MIFTVARHCQVLLETKDSRENRKPRTRRKYTLACTCSQRRKPDGHCVHTLALFESEFKQTRWRDITVTEMTAKEKP